MPARTESVSPATIASLEGGAALLRGDTHFARVKHGEAGEVLLKRAAGALRQEERHLTWFLAATQFYKGGHYQRAAQVAAKIEARFIESDLRESLNQFIRQARERTSPTYPQDTRRVLLRLWERNEFNAVLQMLAEHPYVLDPDALAFGRAVMCERLGDYRAAANFFATAYRIRPEPGFATMAGGYLFYIGAQQAEAARCYAEHLAQAFPHAAVLAAASVLWLQAARVAPALEADGLFRKQLDLFEVARTRYLGLPQKDRANQDVQEIVRLAFDCAAMSYLKIGDEARAAALGEEAQGLWSNSAEVWNVRGLTARSDEEAEQYFRRAAALGAGSYTPYYHLGLAAYGRQEYKQAVVWARQALAHSTPAQQGAARLHAFTAACLDMAGGDRREADALFQRAMSLDPGDEEIRKAYDLFRTSAHAPPPAPRPRGLRATEGLDLLLTTQRQMQTDRVSREVRRILQPAGVN